MSLTLIFLGIVRQHDVETKGYFIDGRSGVPIVVGEEGLITAYALIIGGVSILIYGIYLTNIKTKE